MQTRMPPLTGVLAVALLALSACDNREAMQCMMKGICAQCLCKQIDPASGEEYFVYSCYNQDQELDRVDFENLNARLRQNSVQEKLSNLWLDHLLERDRIDHRAHRT